MDIIKATEKEIFSQLLNWDAYTVKAVLGKVALDRLEKWKLKEFYSCAEEECIAEGDAGEQSE